MKKRCVMSKTFLLILGLFFFSFTIANVFAYNVTNISVKQNYSFGEVISGSFNLAIEDVSNNTEFSSDFGEMSLVDFIEANGKTLFCPSYNCENIYKVSGSGTSSLPVQATSQEKEFGFLFNGNNMVLSSFNISVLSSFPVSSTNQISITIADSYVWKYDDSSSDLSQPRAVAKGYFNESATMQTQTIGSTKYCERVSLLESKSHFLGANISGSGVVDFLMTLKKGNIEKANCNFTKTSSTSYSDLSGCFVNFSESLSLGDYEVCISSINAASTVYSLKSESSGQNSGYYGNSLSAFVADYSLFAITPKYSANSGSINFNSAFYTQATNAINSYLQTRYSRNCLSGCVVPISFVGENIATQIAGIDLRYTSVAGSGIVDKIYNITKEAPKVNFSGSLNLEYFNWRLGSIGNTSFELYLDDDKIINATLRVLNSPVIIRVLPSEIPAGIESIIFAEVENTLNTSVYRWNFGDNSSIVTTNKSQVSHLYSNITSYNLTLEVSGGAYSSTKSFTINTTSPKDYLNGSLALKRQALSKVYNDSALLPTLYRQYVIGIMGLDGYKTQLDNLQSQYQTAYSPEQYLSLARSLSSIVLPLGIATSDKFVGSILYDSSLIKPELVSQLTGSSSSNPEAYRSAVLEWQLDNTNSTVTREKMILIKESNQISDLITSYKISISSSSDQPSYFIIQDGDLHFSSSSSSTKPIGSSAMYFDVPANGQLNTEFFVNGSKDLIMFISPRLSLLNANTTISSCNFNKVCEKDLEENYKNCNSDCKAVWPTIWWIIIFVFLALVVYTILQVWYKMKYEKYLFKNRDELFNLIMFINNAHLNKMSDPNIKASLLQKGWSSEQIDYAFKRADGRNPGMFEIIPIDMIIAKVEKRKAEKTSNKQLPPPTNPYPNMPARGQQSFSRGTR